MNETRRKKLARRPRIKGLCAQARRLSVCREHLQKVLSGQRQSRSLMARVQALKADQAKAPPRNNRTKNQDQ